MTTTEQKRLMQNVFGGMMSAGHFRNQTQMTKELKAVYYLLGTQEHLSTQECDNCLLYFFREYALGCSQPISDEYIKTNMIPIVKNFPSMDLAWGASWIMSAKLK